SSRSDRYCGTRSRRHRGERAALSISWHRTCVGGVINNIEVGRREVRRNVRLDRAGSATQLTSKRRRQNIVRRVDRVVTSCARYRAGDAERLTARRGAKAEGINRTEAHRVVRVGSLGGAWVTVRGDSGCAAGRKREADGALYRRIDLKCGR